MSAPTTPYQPAPAFLPTYTPWAPKNRPLHLHAVEPGNLAVISAFLQDRANRLPEQTQRRVYGGAARARRHGGGIMKIFHWEGEPQ